MRKILGPVFLMFLLVACDKHDPVLPGTRVDVFDTGAPRVLNIAVKNLPENVTATKAKDCPYVQRSDNTIWDGDRKIFSGFQTTNFVTGTRTPVCAGGYIYAGLSTGELVKVNPKNRELMWIADVYRPSNMTGGASVLDIIAPAQIFGGYVYVGGLGGAFCKISDATGVPQWCTNIGVEHPFVIVGDVAYVVDTDNNLNAVRLRDGALYWRVAVKKASAPEYINKTVRVGGETFDAADGVLQ
jgi:outer membrane protein assembly factor BamB